MSQGNSFKQTKMSLFSFTKLENGRVEKVLSVWGVSVGGGRMWGKNKGGENSANSAYTYMSSEKIIPVEIIPGMGEG
jgi:hypothetical protein